MLRPLPPMYCRKFKVIIYIQVNSLIQHLNSTPSADEIREHGFGDDSLVTGTGADLSTPVRNKIFVASQLQHCFMCI